MYKGFVRVDVLKEQLQNGKIIYNTSEVGVG